MTAKTSNLLYEFMRTVRTVASYEVQEAALLKVMAQHGYDIYVLDALPVFGKNGVHPKVLITNASENWQEAYQEAGGYTFDPVVHHCLEKQSSLLWSAIKLADLAVPMRDVHQISVDAGYRVGVSIPLVSRWSVFGYRMSFVQQGVSDPAEHDAQFAENEAELIMLAEAFFNHAEMSGQIISAYGLTDDEISLLEMVSRGVTQAHIATGLSCHLNTVKNRLKSIRRKLDVNTDQEAIVIAMSLSILNPVGFKKE